MPGQRADCIFHPKGITWAGTFGQADSPISDQEMTSDPHKAGAHLMIALRNEKPVRIQDVGRGSACECACATCGAALVARKGSLRRHHFAHLNGNECSAAPLESAIHSLAKRMVVRPGFKLQLPKYALVLPKLRGKNVRLESVSRPSTEVEGVGGRQITVLRGANEVQVGTLRADAIVKVGSEAHNKELIVEIAVHHPCTKAKRALFRRNGAPAIEIHLCSLVHDEYTKAGETCLEDALSCELSDPNNVEWLYHPAEEALRPDIARWVRDFRTRRPPRIPKKVKPKAARDSRAIDTNDVHRKEPYRETRRTRLDRWLMEFQERHGRVPDKSEYLEAFSKHMAR